MKYEDYLKTKHWKEFRKYVYTKTRRGKKCRVCGSTHNLNIHHKKYYRKNGSVLFKEKLGDIMVLCYECHGLWHEIYGTKNDWNWL